MSLNIANVDKLLAFVRALPPEHFSMSLVQEPSCGTPGCIIGAAQVALGNSGCMLGLKQHQSDALYMPPGFSKADTTGDFPLARAIDVVQHLRDTGEVDWARFPAENYRNSPAAPKLAWTPPVVIAVEPELPESLTSLLRQPVEPIDAG